MTQQPFAPGAEGILTQITEGMRVYDREDQQIGTVRSVHLGAVSARDEARGLGPATVSAEETTQQTLLEGLAQTLAPDPLPEPVRASLLRQGFIRIDCTGLFAADRCAMPEQIVGVSDDRITLRVSREALPKC